MNYWYKRIRPSFPSKEYNPSEKGVHLYGNDVSNAQLRFDYIFQLYDMLFFFHFNKTYISKPVSKWGKKITTISYSLNWNYWGLLHQLVVSSGEHVLFLWPRLKMKDYNNKSCCSSGSVANSLTQIIILVSS